MQKRNSTVWNPWRPSQFWRLLVRHKQLNNLNAIHCCCQDICLGLTTASPRCSFCIRDCPFQVTVTVGTRRNVNSTTSLHCKSALYHQEQTSTELSNLSRRRQCGLRYRGWQGNSTVLKLMEQCVTLKMFCYIDNFTFQ